MNENEMDLGMSGEHLRPWWSVRAALLAALAVLIITLAVLLARPELLDHGLKLAGL